MSKKSNHTARRLKAALALRGLTLAGWARARGYPRVTVWNAVHGRRHGEKSRAIRSQLEPLILSNQNEKRK